MARNQRELGNELSLVNVLSKSQCMILFNILFGRIIPDLSLRVSNLTLKHSEKIRTCSTDAACFDLYKDIVISNFGQGNLDYGEVLWFGIPAKFLLVYREFPY